MPPADRVTIQLTIPQQLQEALLVAAGKSGRDISEEISARIRASFQTPAASPAVTDADILAVTSRVALMAGRRGSVKNADLKRRRARDVKK